MSSRANELAERDPFPAIRDNTISRQGRAPPPIHSSRAVDSRSFPNEHTLKTASAYQHLIVSVQLSVLIGPLFTSLDHPMQAVYEHRPSKLRRLILDTDYTLGVPRTQTQPRFATLSMALASA